MVGILEDPLYLFDIYFDNKDRVLALLNYVTRYEEEKNQKDKRKNSCQLSSRRGSEATWRRDDGA